MLQIDNIQVAVLGSGPAGILAALEMSRDYRTALITHHLPSVHEYPRVEAVPASLLALLIEYGIHPRRIGVERLHETRLIAWESVNFTENAGSVAAHIERPALDLALFDALIASGRVEIMLSQLSVGTIDHLRQQNIRLIDATGRRSVSSRKRIGPAKPWAARTFLASKKDCSAGDEFRIAALPTGFVYRLGSASFVTLGIVGRGNPGIYHPRVLEQHLRVTGAGWILDGLPPIADMTQGRPCPASVQWTTGDVGMRIGDAALARDTLSSQGLASGISEALYAAAIRDNDGENLLSLRQTEQRISHLKSLANSIALCHARNDDVWREYAEFVTEHLIHEEPLSRVVLSSRLLRRSSSMVS